MKTLKGYTPEQQELGNVKLLELADILDVVDAEHAARGEPPFSMRTELHDCGSPACAWGHYAVSTPARKEAFIFGGVACNYNDAQEEFFLSNEHWRELFGGYDCNDAKTGKDAAIYIRQFVTDRRAYLNEGREYTHGYVPGSAS